MSGEQPLRGACSCGRNQYAIVIPSNDAEQAEVYFDTSTDDRRTQAAPLTAWLRVPLEWYQSCTTSFFPDETHTAIRRTFTPPHAPYCKRNFCGFCGTPLTYWAEEPPEEADYMSVTVGSLFGEDQSTLEDLDLLPKDNDIRESIAPASTSLTPAVPSASHISHNEPQMSVRHRTGTIDGIPWFEEMIEGSRLGRVGKRRRGVGGDDSTHIEWEVSEWQDSQTNVRTDNRHLMAANSRTSAKRKTPEVGGRTPMTESINLLDLQVTHFSIGFLRK